MMKMYDHMPTLPRRCGRNETCMSMPLFRPRGCPPPRREPCCDLWPRPGYAPKPCCPPQPPKEVVLTNPCDPCEQVTVALSVDECGNLLVCVRRGGYPL